MISFLFQGVITVGTISEVNDQRVGVEHGQKKGHLGQGRSGDQQPGKRRLHQRDPLVQQIERNNLIRFHCVF